MSRLHHFHRNQLKTWFVPRTQLSICLFYKIRDQLYVGLELTHLERSLKSLKRKHFAPVSKVNSSNGSESSLLCRNGANIKSYVGSETKGSVSYRLILRRPNFALLAQGGFVDVNLSLLCWDGGGRWTYAKHWIYYYRDATQKVGNGIPVTKVSYENFPW